MQIVIDQLSKHYSRSQRALHDVSLTIEAGITGLLGPNGAGKTTLMRILATLMQPSAGSAAVGGLDVRDPAQRWQIKQLLGYLPQDVAFYGNLSAQEFLRLVSHLKGQRDVPTQRQQIEAVLKLTGLSDVARKRIKTFSGGMKRRLGIAQALLGDPQILIVDEPTVGLDPRERTRFRNLLVELAAERLVLFSSHILEDIAQTCQRIAVLNRGMLTFHGTASELQAQAQGYVWEFTAERWSSPTATLVTTLPTAAGMLYRVLASEKPHPEASAVTPTLEESYLWFTGAQR